MKLAASSLILIFSLSLGQQAWASCEEEAMVAGRIDYAKLALCSSGDASASEAASQPGAQPGVQPTEKQADQPFRAYNWITPGDQSGGQPGAQQGTQPQPSGNSPGLNFGGAPAAAPSELSNRRSNSSDQILSFKRNVLYYEAAGLNLVRSRVPEIKMALKIDRRLYDLGVPQTISHDHQIKIIVPQGTLQDLAQRFRHRVAQLVVTNRNGRELGVGAGLNPKILIAGAPDETCEYPVLISDLHETVNMQTQRRAQCAAHNINELVRQKNHAVFFVSTGGLHIRGEVEEFGFAHDVLPRLLTLGTGKNRGFEKAKRIKEFFSNSGVCVLGFAGDAEHKEGVAALELNLPFFPTNQDKSRPMRIQVNEPEYRTCQANGESYFQGNGICRPGFKSQSIPMSPCLGQNGQAQSYVYGNAQCAAGLRRSAQVSPQNVCIAQQYRIEWYQQCPDHLVDVTPEPTQQPVVSDEPAKYDIQIGKYANGSAITSDWCELGPILYEQNFGVRFGGEGPQMAEYFNPGNKTQLVGQPRQRPRQQRQRVAPRHRDDFVEQLIEQDRRTYDSPGGDWGRTQPGPTDTDVHGEDRPGAPPQRRVEEPTVEDRGSDLGTDLGSVPEMGDEVDHDSMDVPDADAAPPVGPSTGGDLDMGQYFPAEDELGGGEDDDFDAGEKAPIPAGHGKPGGGKQNQVNFNEPDP